MSDATLPSPAIIDSDAPSLKQKNRRRGLLTALVGVLHHSRRLEAQLTIRRYRHLIDEKSRAEILKGIEDVPE